MMSGPAQPRARQRGDHLIDDEDDDYYGHENDQLLRERQVPGAAAARDAGVQPYVVGMFTLLGTGCLTPWNSLAGAVDFFGALLPHCDPADAFAVANFGANLLFLVVQLKVCKCFSARAVVGLLVYALVLLYPIWLAWAFFHPISDADFVLEQTLFSVLVGGVALAGAANAGLQVVILALAGQMGSECTGAFMNGQAWAGIITSVCRVLSKLFFEDRQPFEALRLSSMLYFCTSVSVVLLCLWSWFSLQRLPVTKEARVAMSRPESRRESHASVGSASTDLIGDRTAVHADVLSRSLEVALDPDREMDVGNPPEWDDEDEGGIFEAWKRVWLAAVGVMVVFWATLAVFPGVVTRIPSANYDPRNWMPVILIATFNMGDLMGRYSAGLLDPYVSAQFLGIMILARIAIVPALVCIQLYPATLGSLHDEAAVGGVLLLASSNGLTASLTLIKGQRRVMPGLQNETASTILALAMCLGLVLGAVTALPISALDSHYAPVPPSQE